MAIKEEARYKLGVWYQQTQTMIYRTDKQVPGVSQVVLAVKNPPVNARDIRDQGSIPWRRKWQPTPVFLPGESHGQRSLVGYSPQGRTESDILKQLSRHAQSYCIAEGTRFNMQVVINYKGKESEKLYVSLIIFLYT